MAAQDACLPLRRINLTDKVALIRDVGHCPLETVAKNFRDVNAYAVIVGLSANRLARQAAPGAGEAGEVVKKPEEIDMEEDVDVHITPKFIIFFVGSMCCSLVFIYLFIQYLVAVIGVFEPLFYRVPIGTTRLPSYAFPCFYGSLEVRQVFLVIFSVCLAFSWVVIRHEPKAWLLQDFLGIIFSIYILKSLRMPNLKVICTLLVLLFFYDIFFVFITPYLVPKTMPHNQTGSFAKSSGYGDSIMVEVARGGGSHEQIPMVMRVPHFGNEDIAACSGQYSVLGFGDILIPADDAQSVGRGARATGRLGQEETVR
ncbi:hypothetical protein V5799_032635 [Amblyomma americanum]|uniref:Signal peptide peptidase-like 2B n=1 Tax=Amblyomma americanum TaxID=6943 RepID=A0AAQ4DQL2_AMBAM